MCNAADSRTPQLPSHICQVFHKAKSIVYRAASLVMGKNSFQHSPVRPDAAGLAVKFARQMVVIASYCQPVSRIR